MGKFRKKPVVIEATQFFRLIRPWPEGVEEVRDGEFIIDTLEGRAYAVTDGDWIITGVKGERYPCKPDVFVATYDAEPEAEPAPQP